MYAYACHEIFSTYAVVAVLKKNFVELCRCLPKDHVETIKRLKRRVRVGDRLKHDLDLLPSIDERNGMILAIMLGPLHSDVQVLTFCDVLEDVVDNSTSKKFIHKLRSGMNGVVFVCNLTSLVQPL